MDKYLSKNKQKTLNNNIETNPTQTIINTILSDNEINYINSLSEKELKSYHIANQHLKTSFELSKAQGYHKWLKTQS